MGLTANSMGAALLQEDLNVIRKTEDDIVIALAGNPNVGKSTVFNELTGLNQHTGNWPGKTVATARGSYTYCDTVHIMVDLPGTYSLMVNSAEEEIARDFICFGNPDVTVVVVDATCLERNLNLALQTLEITQQMIVCVNLMDEAEKKKISIDLDQLSRLLGVPVIGTSARSGKGLEELKACIFRQVRQREDRTPMRLAYPPAVEEAIAACLPAVENVAGKKLPARWLALKLLDSNQQLSDEATAYLAVDMEQHPELTQAVDRAKTALREKGIGAVELRDTIVGTLVDQAEVLAHRVTSYAKKDYNATSRRIDKVITSRRYGIPIMIAMLGAILWLTITGANYPSAALSAAFGWVEEQLTVFFHWCHAPEWLYGILVQGIYRTLSWVVAVMLPPMAIFFPLFTLLEDLGYLPRVAFNLDNFFQKSHACGKQALTMCMGFGCNAAGVIGCRIIDSPRERLIAILTNNFVPCNGRFPTLISLITIFFAASSFGVVQSISSALFLCAMIVFGVMVTLFVSKMLSKTLLRGVPTSFTLELPPYRRPQVGKIFVRSIFDRTLFVLGRAVTVSIPAGLIIWCMANIHVGGGSLLQVCSGFLDPFARLIGLDGVILMAFILGFPANEIVIPIILMAYLAGGQMMEYESLASLKTILTDHGWTAVTALCTMLFSLLHFPCGTTCMTIRKETGSWKWTAAAFLIPTALGIVVCFLVASFARLLGIG